MPSKVDAARKLVGKPLTLAEKILYSHLFEHPSAPMSGEKITWILRRTA